MLPLFLTVLGRLCLSAFAFQDNSHNGPQTHVINLEAKADHNLGGRRIIALNGNQETFGPPVRVRAGDTVQISLLNQICSELEAQNDANDELMEEYCVTGLHFHGLVPIGNDVDGVPGLTQPPIKPGETYWYNFTIPQDVCGTFWYHSHSAIQYGDGLRGTIVVECDEYNSLVNRVFQALEKGPVNNGPVRLPPKVIQLESNLIHEETVTLSDWYDDWNLDIEREKVLSPDGTTDPHMDGSLINGSEDDHIEMKMDRDVKAAVIRVVNAGMAGTQVLHAEGRNMVVLETDGVLVKPYAVETLSLAVGQRYTIMVATQGKWDPIKFINGCNKMMGYITKVFWMMQRNPVGELNFEGKIKNLPGFYRGELFQQFEPIHGTGLWGSTKESDDNIQRITLNYEYIRNEATVQQYGTHMYKVNGKTMEEYMENPIEMEGGKTVEIIINSIDHMRHPWHMHGHHFQVISMGEGHDGQLRLDDPGESDAKRKYQQDLHFWEESKKTPMTRDSINIAGASFAVLRIRTDFPGSWLLHCHVEWHVAKGLGVVLKELESPQKAGQEQIEQSTIAKKGTSKAKVLGVYFFIMSLLDAALYFFIM